MKESSQRCLFKDMVWHFFFTVWIKIYTWNELYLMLFNTTINISIKAWRQRLNSDMVGCSQRYKTLLQKRHLQTPNNFKWYEFIHEGRTGLIRTSIPCQCKQQLQRGSDNLPGLNLGFLSSSHVISVWLQPRRPLWVPGQSRDVTGNWIYVEVVHPLFLAVVLRHRI